MSNTAKIIGSIAFVAIFVAGLWYFILGPGAKQSANTGLVGDPSQGRPPYYSKPTYDRIKVGYLGDPSLVKFGETATQDVRPWRLPESDEFGSVYGTLDWTFGYDIKSPPKGMPDDNAIFSWCKGMNLDIVHLQGYIVLFKDDIVWFYNNVTQTYHGNIKAGAFVA